MQHPYKPQIISNFDELPELIRNIASSMLENSLKAHIKNVQFGLAVVYDLEQYFADYPEIRDPKSAAQSGRSIVPKYNLHYTYLNPADRQQQYSFQLDLDEYGQVLNYDLPRHDAGTIEVLNGKNEAIEQAEIYARSAGYQTEPIHSKLTKSKDQDTLIWNIWFKQEQKRTNKLTTSTCRVISVDILSGWIVYDTSGQLTEKL
ncbi:MAG: hypothetical protein QM594_02160 [Niabella sp.]